MKRILQIMGLFTAALLVSAGCSQENLWNNRSVTRHEVQSKVRLVLREALKSRDPASRCHALETWALFADDEAKRLIRESLFDSSPAVRAAAAIAAGDTQDAMAQTALHTLLRENFISVQLAAGYAMERLGDKRFKNWYDNVLMGEDPLLSGMACMLLGKLGENDLRNDSREKLWKVLKKDNQDALVRLQAAEALAKLGDQTILERLLAYAGSTYADDRMIALSGLSELDKRGNPNAYAALVMLAGDPQMEVKLAAFGALGHRNDKANLNEVRTAVLWSDPAGDAIASARVRGLALMTLGKIGLDQDLAVIYDAMNASMPYVQLAAARAAIEFLDRQKKGTLLKGM